MSLCSGFSDMTLPQATRRPLLVRRLSYLRLFAQTFFRFPGLFPQFEF